MSQHWHQDEEETWDKEEYVEVEERKVKEAILRAEEEQKAKQHQQNILKIIDDPPPKPHFIPDDRQRIHPTLQTQPSTTSNAKPEQRSSQPNPPKKEKRAQYRVKEEEAENPKETGDKKKDVQERTKQTKKEGDEPSQHPRKKYVEKGEQKTTEKKPKKQITIIGNQEVELRLVKEETDEVNQVYIGKRDISIYVDRAKQLLEQWDFIVLKSFAIYISKTVTVAGLVAREFPCLKMIHIPGTVEVLALSSKGEQRQKKAALRILLSLKELEKRHIGYQEVKGVQAEKNDRRVKYKEKEKPRKEEPRYAQKRQYDRGQKKSSYADKPSGKRASYNRRREQSYSSQDERQLR